MTRVAFVGLGAMGSRMAGRLLEAGHDLVVWNRTREKASALADRGATVADTPAATAARADAVITMVSDPAALRDVTQGPSGVLAGLARDAVVIEMSTVGPPAIAELGSRIPDGVRLIDAPVLGSIDEAENGKLDIFVGAEAADFERWRPTLSTLGTPMHVGPVGSGAAAKLVANSTLFAALGALGECLALADALGLSRDTAFDVLAKTRLAAEAERRRPMIESGQYPTRFALGLARKDADLIAQVADGRGIDLRVAAAARSWLADAERAGWTERDYAAVLSWIVERARRRP